MNGVKLHLQGVDLKIDPNVQRICEAYNATSGSTRSVLYFLLLINVLSLIAVVNSHRSNWTQQRIESIDAIVKKGIVSTAMIEDSTERTIAEDNLRTAQLRRDQNIRSKIDNYQNVHIPILGNAFDINNLSFISGITFILLLTILRFTLTREKNNLRLSLEAISDRYPDSYTVREFDDTPTFQRVNRNTLTLLINHTRRKYHYNFLSMNEVFNIPPLEVSDNYLQKTLLARIVSKNLFYFPYFIYFIILVNDLTTIKEGFETSPIHTSITLAFAILFASIISYLCHQCNIQKVFVHNLFTDFYNNGYKMTRTGYNVFYYRPVDYLICPVRPWLKIIRYCWKGFRKEQSKKKIDDLEIKDLFQ